MRVYRGRRGIEHQASNMRPPSAAAESPGAPQKLRYDLFISYSRASDGRLAPAQDLIAGFRNWCADGNARLPQGWSPDRLEAGFTEILAEGERWRENSLKPIRREEDT
jgi:hypothetical protein